MTEEPAPENPVPENPVPDAGPVSPEAEQAAAGKSAAAPSVPRSTSLMPLLVLLDLVILALAATYVWRFPPNATEARLAAVERRLAAGSPAAPAMDAALAARVDDLATRLAALEQARAATAALAARLAEDEAKLDAVAKAEAARAEAAPATPATSTLDAEAVSARLQGDEAKLDALKESAAAMAREIANVAGRAAAHARFEAAEAALAAGRPLGDLPGAPPALARFATMAPPTLAGLRAAFPLAAAARAAAPSPALGSRLMDWIGAVVTVRRGDQVLLGDTLAARLAAAQSALDGDDLAAALALLAPIEGAPGAALAAWKQEAGQLLAARRALADLMAAG